jgi:hypothetical protein
VTTQEAIKVLDMCREGQRIPVELIQLALSITDQQPAPEKAERYEQFLAALRQSGLL